MELYNFSKHRIETFYPTWAFAGDSSIAPFIPPLYRDAYRNLTRGAQGERLSSPNDALVTVLSRQIADLTAQLDAIHKNQSKES